MTALGIWMFADCVENSSIVLLPEGEGGGEGEHTGCLALDGVIEDHEILSC
jgi:hypothetical protein